MTTMATHREPEPVAIEDEVESESEDESENEEGFEVDEEYDDDDIIDHSTFSQLLEMDDEDDHEFSRSLVSNYYDQAERTFEELDEAMEKLDFTELSRLGHFLKGSSAALGLIKIRTSCEKLQHYGSCKDADGKNAITKEEAKELSQALLTQMGEEYDEARIHLDQFYARLE